VCGCEGTVAGKGSHTLAFVRWHFPCFLSVFMQQKFNCHCVVVLFFRLACNGWQLHAGGNFKHQLSFGELPFKYTQNCPTKHVTRHLRVGVVIASGSVFRFSIHSVCSDFYSPITCPEKRIYVCWQ